MITDNQLKTAAGELETAMITALPESEECCYEFSASFSQKMKKVIFRANHPFIARLGRRVAAAVLVILLLGSSVLLISPSARASFWGWLKEIYGTAMHYQLPEGNPADASPNYSLGWIPEEYTYLETLEHPKNITCVYTDSNGNLLYFDCHFSLDGSAIDFFLEVKDHTHKAVTVGGLPADLYLSGKDNESNALIWQNENGTILFLVMGKLDESVLLQIAESIVPGEK